MRSALQTRLEKIEAVTPLRPVRVLRFIGDTAEYGRFIAECDIDPDEDVLIIRRFLVAPGEAGAACEPLGRDDPQKIEIAPEAFDGASDRELAAIVSVLKESTGRTA